MPLSREEKLNRTRIACENDLVTFIKTVAPYRQLGHCHLDVINWWQRHDAKDCDLVLLPRGHQKSALIAFRTAQFLVKYPWESVLYTSATSGLADLQLGIIKDIMLSRQFTALWPNMIHPEEGKRTQWSAKAITVDHPMRKEHGARDPSIVSAGVGTTTAGRHAGLIVFDDLVVPENAYTEEGRRQIAAAYSQFASIANPGAQKWIVGTRYHPGDLYNDIMSMRAVEYDEDGELVEEWSVYDVYQKVVEEDGQFLWPRQKRSTDSAWFGFNHKILAQIKAEYLDKAQFYAQYYNDPNDPGNARLDNEKFKYYDKSNITSEGNTWYFSDKKLNIIAAMDFAFSTKSNADYTTIAVVGVDKDHQYYILDLDRFKTDKISVYFNHLYRLWDKWKFYKCVMEVSVAQKVIVTDLKTNYIVREGIPLQVIESRPTTKKEERHAAAVIPRYDNEQVYHYRGGYCEVLEKELVSAKPEHDDLVDVICSSFEHLKAPADVKRKTNVTNITYHPRFGGVQYR